MNTVPGSRQTSLPPHPVGRKATRPYSLAFLLAGGADYETWIRRVLLALHTTLSPFLATNDFLFALA